MGYFIFIFVCNLVIPVSMLIFGSLFKKNVPREINWIFGYRTAMSMKNQETWRFAHNYCGRIWTKAGAILLAVSAAVSACSFAFGKDVADAASVILCGVQIVFLIGSIFPTEKALRRNFDKDGNRRV